MVFRYQEPAGLGRETSPAGAFSTCRIGSVLQYTFCPDVRFLLCRTRESVLLFVVLIALAIPYSAWARVPAPAQGSGIHAQAHSTGQPSTLTTELRARQEKLEEVKESGDPAEIGDASKQVIASTLRQIGRLKLIEGAAPEAIEIYRRSISFENSADTHVDLAAAYLSANRVSDSLSELANTILVNPENAQAWHLDGKILMTKNDYSHAANALQQSLALQANANVSYLLGSCALQLKKYDEARKVFEDLAAAEKDRPGLHLLFADAYRQAGYTADADREIKNAFRLDPNAQRAHSRLIDIDPAAQFDPWMPANPTAQQRQSAQSQVRELSKILASALNDLGTAEARQEKFDLALAHFHEAEQWHADTPGLMRNIGMAAMRVPNYPEAARALRLVLAKDPNDQVARSLLGTASYSTHNFAEAARVFTPLGDSALREPELAYAWADSLIKTTQFPQATVLLDKLEKQPLPADTLVLMAQAWSQMGNYPRAVETCHKALQLDPKLAQAHIIAGMALIRSDHPAEAVPELKSALQLDPDNNDAQYDLAFALLQLSHSDEAVVLLRRVLARDPDHAQANYELGRELLEEGNKEEAIRYLEAAARLNPKLDAVHYQLQSAYRAVGRKEDADRELKIYRDMKAKNRNVNVTSPMGPPAKE